MSKVCEKFKWNAADYAKHSSIQQTWARELIDKLELNGSETLLDIGCGDGKVTAEIARFLSDGTVIGVDSSKEMLQLAKHHYPQNSYPNLSFVQQDARNLNFREKFDIVFSNAALHWVLDHKPVLAGIHKVLRPGGRVLIQMGGKGNAAQVVAVVEKIMQLPQWRDYFKGFHFPYGFYSPEEYAPWVDISGLELVRIELVPKNMVYKSLDTFKGWFRTTWIPYIEKVPLHLQEQFIDFVTEKYIEANPLNRNGEICTKMQRLEFTAKKAQSVI